MRITVALPAGRGVGWWAERNAASPVPGRWPYGLDALRDGSAEVDTVEVEPLGRLTRQLSLRTGRPPRAAAADKSGSGEESVAICWDESLAPALLHRVRAQRRYAGVIWATDQVGAQGETPQTRLIGAALRRLDGLWVLSRPQAQAVRDWLGADCPPVHVLTFGVDPGFYRARPYPIREEGAAPKLVSIGGDRDRDPQTLFAALELVLAERPELEVLVQTKTGSPAPAGVRTETFVPHDQVRRLYAEASVVALATRDNLHGSGMTVGLEAMSVGRPVVATGTPGMEDYIADGETGHLVPVGDSEAMAARILGLLADPVTAAAMGEAGRSAVAQRYTTAAMCAQLREIVAGSGAL